MINAIIPFAGPGFVNEMKQIKDLTSIRDKPLLEYVLKSRPWHQKVKNYVSVLRDGELQSGFAQEFLWKWFSECHVVFLGSDTHGAACSAVAAISYLRPDDTRLVVDLVDIAYSCSTKVGNIFTHDQENGGRTLIFSSRSPAYSYLLCDEEGRVTRAAENVISENASAGTYFFRDQNVFLQAFAHSVKNKATLMHNGLLYVCPLLNGVLAQGMLLDKERVWNVDDIKLNAATRI